MKRNIILFLLFSAFLFQLHSQTQQELDQLYAVDSSWIVHIEKVNNTYDLPLLFACDSGNVDRVLELLSKGAEVNVRTTSSITPIMYAAQQGHLDIVKILILNGAEIDAEPETEMTAFLAAVANNHFYVAEYLLINGADINQRDFKYNSALHYAIAYGYNYMTELLLFYKANIEILDYQDKTPLFIAVKYNDVELTELLLSYGANADTAEDKGFTPLMLAAEQGYDTIVDILLNAGAEIDKKNDCNMTALSYAVKNGEVSTVELLSYRGASANQKIQPSTSPITLAKKYDQDSIKTILKYYGAKRNWTPGIETVMFGFNYFNGNSTDYMMGFDMGVKEAKTQLELMFGLNFRPSVRGVLADIDGVSYQFWEKRDYINLGFDRHVIKFTLPLDYEIGLFAGTHLVYTYGNYRGSDIKAERGFRFMPKVGIICNSLFYSTRIYYSYLDMKVYDISPHRFNLSLIFKLDLDLIKQYNKSECERYTSWEL